MEVNGALTKGGTYKHGINNLINRLSFFFALCYVILSAPEVSARGRLMEPTQRSSLWTRGFDSPINDDDTGLNCGGRWIQHGVNNGKCGVCGDRYDVTPRENEPGGKYANGIIANTYTTDDQSILVVVDIQSALGGYFEFRICPHNNPKTSVSQECLDRHQLRVWDVITKEPKYQYTPKSIGLHRLRVEIPQDMTCTQCVLQWKWHTAKDWGRCPDGNARLGCGPQEEFYNCADIAIEQATANNQRLTLPEVTLTDSNLNQPINYEMAQPSFDRQNVFSNIPMSFLPQEIFKAGNIGPVIPPKFDFFDNSATSTDAPSTTTQPEVMSAANGNSPVQDIANNNNNVVELIFNDNAGLATENAQQTSTSNSEVTYQSTGSTSESNVNITVSSLVPGEMSSTEPKPTESAFLNNVTEQIQNIASSSASSPTSSSEQPITSTSGQAETSTSGVEATTTETQNIPAGGVIIPSFALGDLGTSGMLVKVGTGADDVQPTQDTPIVSSQATNTQDTTVGSEQTSSQPTTTTEARLEPVPTLLRSRRGPIASVSRTKRQAGPPPPPPIPGSNSAPPPAPPAPGAPPAGPSAPGPDYAPKPAQQSSRTISFGGLIGDSFSRGGTTQHSFMSQQDFQMSMGGRSDAGPIPGEALSEMTMTGAQMHSGPVDMQGYPPDMMLAPGPVGAVPGPYGGPGGSLSEMYLDPALGADGSLLSNPVDANPASFAKPGIPPPPKQSSAELEAAIIGAPQLTSAVSDTQISTNAADLVGASYIAELGEGRSNQAETSTAARHGTMIIPGDQSVKGGGRVMEYLAGSKGTSMRETAADTRAEIRSATMSLARFGYQPTAEQVLSGNIGIHHPTENLDTTNLEPIGPSPNDAAGAAAPGILSAILGGQPTQVTDASLDPAVQKTREDLIRQLGEAMGVIGTSKTSAKKASDIGRGQVVSLVSVPQEQQQVVNTAAQQQVVNAQQGVMGVGLDTNMFGDPMMDMGMSMGNQKQAGGAAGMDMFGGMDLQSLFGAADAAVNSQANVQNNQRSAVDASLEQSMFGGQSSQSLPIAAAQTGQQQRQPQTALDLVDIGMPGMTIEEMMTLLNMEQQGGTAASSSASSTSSSTSASSQKASSTSSQASATMGVGIDMESAMMGGAASQSVSPKSGSKSSMESMMFSQASVNSINNNQPQSVQDRLSGLSAQSLSEMSTSQLEALLQEATGGSPTKEAITQVQPSAAPSTTTLGSIDNTMFDSTSLLTAPLDRLTTAELEALIANAPPTQPPTTTTTTPVPVAAAAASGGQASTESLETRMIKAALRNAVFEATGTEFDFSQMTQAEMNDMVQMFGGLQNLQQYVPPELYLPEPAVPLVPTAPPPAATPAPITPAPTTEAPIVQPQQPTLDVPANNVDFAAMQQFLNPAMFGVSATDFNFGQQGSTQGGQPAEADLGTMMSALNPNNTPLNTVDTISLADLLSGNVNMGSQSSQTQVQATQVTDAQLSVNSAQQSGQSSSAIVSETSQSGSFLEPEHMIWDPVQMQWITPSGSLIKDMAVSQQTTIDVQSTGSNQASSSNAQLQDPFANEMASSSSASSSSTGISVSDTLSMESSMTAGSSVGSQASATGVSTATDQQITTPDLSPIVGNIDTQVNTQSRGIAKMNLSDLIPIGEQRTQMTEKASPSTANVDPSPTASTAGSDIVLTREQTTSASIVESPRPPTGVPNQREIMLFNNEMAKKRELDLLLQKQREELRRLEEQRLEQRRKMMAEKQRIEYEKQQLALRKQQMELDAVRQEQLRQRQLMEQQRKQLQEERMRIEQQRLKEIEMAKQKAIEEEKRRIREEQRRIRELEMAKQQAAERERQRIEAERRKKAQAELTRRKAAEQERLRIQEERRKLEEERMRQEAAAAAAAKAKAEAEAAAVAAAAAQAEIAAIEKAAASMVVGHNAGSNVVDVAISTNTSSNETFTPIGAVGGQLTDADAATAMAWQAVVKAAQIQAAGGNVDPNAMITQQQEQHMQQQQLMSMLQNPQGGLNADWMQILQQATGQTTTPKPQTAAPGMAGLDTAALMKLLEEQAKAQQTTTPAPATTTQKPKRKAPIRPDPSTREFVRNMFIDNMAPGVDPLSILIGLTPEMLMKSGVNPLIANSGDLARIVPAVERALGVSLKKIPVPTGPRGRPLTPQPTGFQTLNVRTGPGGGTPGSQRREFLMQQRMMKEMMTMLGIGPEPLEPGDPGYQGPGATGGPAGGGPAAARGGHRMPHQPYMGGHSFGGEMSGGGSPAGGPMGGPMGGAGGPGGGLSAQMGMLGL